MLSKKEIIESHRQIYRYMKSRAKGYEEFLSTDLKKYKKDHDKYEKLKFNPSSIKELMSKIEKSQIVYLGDFHTFDQNSKNMERILRTILKKEKKLLLGMELVHVEDQKYVDAYQNGHITEQEFLSSINYQESWRFPWRHYKSFFKEAKKGKYDIVALNSEGSLAERDKTAAKIIANKIEAFPESSILVLFGELHIVPDKLPALVQNEVSEDLNQMIIHQNLDDVHWRLLESKGHIDENDQIVAFNDNEFVIQTSPPWVKYESMIYWYESLNDDPDFDLHEAIIEDGFSQNTSSNDDNFLYLCERLSKTLPFSEAERSELEDFEIYHNEKIEYVIGLIKENGSPIQRKLHYELIKKGDLLRIPKTKKYYLSHYSVNRLTAMAGLHIYLIYLDSVGINPDELESSKNRTTRFIFYIYRHMISYISSKIFNPFRKCDLYLDILEKSKRAVPLTEKRKYFIVLEVFEEKIHLAEKLKNILTSHDEKNLNSAAKCMGYMLAERLGAIPMDNPNSEEKIFGLIKRTSFTPDDLEELVNLVFSGTQYKKLRKRFF